MWLEKVGTKQRPEWRDKPVSTKRKGVLIRGTHEHSGPEARTCLATTGVGALLTQQWTVTGHTLQKAHGPWAGKRECQLLTAHIASAPSPSRLQPACQQRALSILISLAECHLLCHMNSTKGLGK